MNESVEIDRPKGEAAGPRSNSYNFVPAGDIGRAPGAPCPLAATQRIPFGRSRTLLLRLKDRMRVFYTETQDFSEDELFTVKEGLGQVYADISTKLAPDDFARDLRKLQPSVECVSCPRRQECPGCWDPARDDVFSRDDARVHEILGGLTGRVLDVGGGEATYLAPLAARAATGGIQYVCVDPDPVRLGVLAARYPFAQFAVGRAEELGAELGTFDHVLMLRSYNHLHDPAQALGRALWLLRPGGTLLLVDNVAFGLVRNAAHAARAEAAPENLLEHYRNDGPAEAAAQVEALRSIQWQDGRRLHLVERRDIGPETSNQWLLRYACVVAEPLRA